MVRDARAQVEVDPPGRSTKIRSTGERRGAGQLDRQHLDVGLRRGKARLDARLQIRRCVGAASWRSRRSGRSGWGSSDGSVS